MGETVKIGNPSVNQVLVKIMGNVAITERISIVFVMINMLGKRVRKKRILALQTLAQTMVIVIRSIPSITNVSVHRVNSLFMYLY